MRIFSYETDLFWNLDDYDLFAWNLNKFKKSASQNEYENYIKEKSIEINDSSFFWWFSKTQKEYWLKLSQIIIDVLSISAMSTESEQIFFEAHHTIS